MKMKHTNQIIDHDHSFLFRTLFKLECVLGERESLKIKANDH